MKISLLVLCLALSACSTNPAGEKTFLGRTGDQWLARGENILRTELNAVSSKNPVSVAP